MTKEALTARLAQISAPDAALKEGMVYQVWEDGEITCQKSGKLLWTRTLHCANPGLPFSAPLECFPEQYGTHAYVFVKDGNAANLAREFIANYIEATFKKI